MYNKKVTFKLEVILPASMSCWDREMKNEAEASTHVLFSGLKTINKDQSSSPKTLFMSFSTWATVHSNFGSLPKHRCSWSTTKEELCWDCPSWDSLGRQLLHGLREVQANAELAGRSRFGPFNFASYSK